MFESCKCHSFAALVSMQVYFKPLRQNSVHIFNLIFLNSPSQTAVPTCRCKADVPLCKRKILSDFARKNASEEDFKT